MIRGHMFIRLYVSTLHLYIVRLWVTCVHTKVRIWATLHCVTCDTANLLICYLSFVCIVPGNMLYHHFSTAATATNGCHGTL